MDLGFDVWTIVSILLGLATTVFAVQSAKIKLKINQVYLLGKESVDLARVATKALDDNKITPEEVAEIKQEASEVKTAWNNLLGK